MQWLAKVRLFHWKSPKKSKGKLRDRCPETMIEDNLRKESNIWITYWIWQSGNKVKA
jgi:hypothetical protein